MRHDRLDDDLYLSEHVMKGVRMGEWGGGRQKQQGAEGSEYCSSVVGTYNQSIFKLVQLLSKPLPDFDDAEDNLVQRQLWCMCTNIGACSGMSTAGFKRKHQVMN